MHGIRMTLKNEWNALLALRVIEFIVQKASAIFDGMLRVAASEGVRNLVQWLRNARMDALS